MLRGMMEYLCCPVCKGGLKAEADTESQEDILSGMLVCSKCNESYPISDGIPDLLPPELRNVSQK